MVRKMAGIGFSYLLGLFFASFFSASTGFYVGIAAAAVAVIAWFVAKTKNATVVVCMICFGIGSIYYSVYSSAVYSEIIKFDGYNVNINGKITSYTDYSKDMTSYVIRGTVNDATDATVICFAETKDCRIGDYISICGKASVMENSYTFPTESYYKSKGIYLQINSVSSLNVTSNSGFSLKRNIDSYREYIYSRFKDYLSLEDTAIMSAMLFGDKSGIDDTSRTLLYRAGIGHIMAVSGVHLSVVCSFIWLLLSFVEMNKYIRFVCLIVPMSAFVMLAGMTNSVLRAAVMTLLVYGAGLFGRKADILNSLGISVILLTISCPYVIRDASFLLSMTGVVGIGVVAPEIIQLINSKKDKRHKLGKIKRTFISSVCVSIVIFPVSILFFDEISIASPITNVILMPLCTIMLIFGIIVAMTGGIGFIAYPLLKICGILCKLLLAVTEYIGKLRFSYIPLGYEFVKTIIIICVIFVIIIYVTTKNKRQTIVSTLAMISVCIVSVFIYRWMIPSDNITVAVLSETKGSSIVIHNKSSASVIDLYGGGKASDSVVKYLNSLGIYNIDLLSMTVDYNVSEVIYNKKMELFDIDTALVAESEKSGNSIIGKQTVFISTLPALVEMPYYSFRVYDNNNIVLNVNDAEILAINGKEYNGLDFSGKKYSAVIDYSGTTPINIIQSDIWIANKKDAKVIADAYEKVYISENVKIKIYDGEKIFTEVIENGNGQ